MSTWNLLLLHLWIFVVLAGSFNLILLIRHALERVLLPAIEQAARRLRQRRMAQLPRNAQPLLEMFGRTRPCGDFLPNLPPERIVQAGDTSVSRAPR